MVPFLSTHVQPIRGYTGFASRMDPECHFSSLPWLPPWLEPPPSCPDYCIGLTFGSLLLPLHHQKPHNCQRKHLKAAVIHLLKTLSWLPFALTVQTRPLPMPTNNAHPPSPSCLPQLSGNDFSDLSYYFLHPPSCFSLPAPCSPFRAIPCPGI